MELRAGYKQTEVGVVPEDWDVDCLSSSWSVTDCKHVTAKFISNGYPVASINEVQSRFIDLTDAKKTTQKFYNLLTEGGRKPQAGDLIMSRNATVGEVAQVAKWHPLFAMGQDVCLLRRRSPDISPTFLQAVFRSFIIKNQLSELMVGSTFKRVNVQQIKSFLVPMPKPDEQRAIATALSDVDALIDSLDQLIAKKRAIKQGAMQQLLTGKMRLEGFSGEWETKRLGDAFQFLGTANNPRSDLSGHGEVGYIHYGDIHKGTSSFLDCSAAKIPSIAQGKVGKVAKIPSLMDGDLIMADASEDYEGIGKSVEIVNLNDRKMVAGLHTHLLRGVKEVIAVGFRGYLQYIPAIRNALRSLATGISVYGISKNQVKNIEVALPSVEEQTAIATILSDMDAEITTLEQKRDKTRALKQGMMQELLTGKTRLI